MKLPIGLLLFVFTLAACKSLYFVNEGDQQIIKKDGKCYSQCEVQIDDPNIGTEYFVYTGDEQLEEVEIEYIEVATSSKKTSSKKTRWEKKMRENCVSSDPNDCLVWCLVEVPGEVEKLQVVKDTSATEHWERKVVLGPNEKYESETLLREVLCKEQITDELLNDLYNLFNELGYGGEYFRAAKNDIALALRAYQEDNNLPTCGFDIITLNQLGVEIPLTTMN